MKLNQLITLTRELRTRRLSLTDYAILSLLEDKADWVCLNEIMETLGISNKLATYLTTALASNKGGLIVRERGADRRYVFHALAEDGYALMEQIRTALAEAPAAAEKPAAAEGSGVAMEGGAA